MSIYDSLRSFSVSIRCSTGDGEIASQVALLSPDETFADLHRDGQAAWEGVELRRRPGMWHFLYRGIVAGNASGDPVDLARAMRITKAFTLPYSSLRIRRPTSTTMQASAAVAVMHIALITGMCLARVPRDPARRVIGSLWIRTGHQTIRA